MSEDREEVSFGEVVCELEELHKAGLRGFVAWLQRHWLDCGVAAAKEGKPPFPGEAPWNESEDFKAEWKRVYASDFPGANYLKGWNAAVVSLDGALECYIEEHS